MKGLTSRGKLALYSDFLNPHRETLRKELNLPSKIPPDVCLRKENVPLRLYHDKDPFMHATVVVHARRPGHVHRIFVVCPRCCREIPAGRLLQHGKVHAKKTWIDGYRKLLDEGQDEDRTNRPKKEVEVSDLDESSVDEELRKRQSFTRLKDLGRRKKGES